MIRRVIRFFDKLEDKIRGHLSHYPLVYSVIGGIGVVLFWRGIWHTADMYSFMTGPVSLVLGIVILGLTGVLVSSFIGNSILITGLRGEKKLAEKTQDEILHEESRLKDLRHEVREIENEIAEIQGELENAHKD